MNRVAGESQARVTEAKSTYYFLRRPQIQEYLAHLSCASLWVRRAESIENEFRAVVWTSGEAATHDSLADCCEIGVSHEWREVNFAPFGSVIYRTIFWSAEMEDDKSLVCKAEKMAAERAFKPHRRSSMYMT